MIVPFSDESVESSSCYILAIMLDDPAQRDPIRLVMREQHEVQTSVFYPAIHEFSAYRERFPGIALPKTERAARSAGHAAAVHAHDRRPAGPGRRRARRGAPRMSWQIPLTDVVLSEEDIAAVLECLEGGWLTMGPRTDRFERAFAEFCDVPHAVAVSSGTAALHLALLGAGIGPGDEVLVPALTFVAGRRRGPLLRRHAGVRRLDRLRMISTSIRDDAARLITPKDARDPGHPLDGLRLRPRRRSSGCCAEHGLVLIEDCAQSTHRQAADGRLTGTVGAAGCFSFFSKKQLCVGEGGMVVTERRGDRDQGPLAALARDDLGDLGSPSRLRRDLRRRRRRLQLPDRRASCRARTQPAAARPGRRRPPA